MRLALCAAVALAAALAAPAVAQDEESGGPPRDAPRVRPAEDAVRGPASAGLTLKPTRSLDFAAHEGTWMQPDMAPDGRTILFDLLGDIYALDHDGGTARPLLTGMAWERNPVFSPDGRRFAFISDRSGTDNLWVADADGSNPRQLSRDISLNILTSPAWAPDGRSVTLSRMVHSILAFDLWRYPLDGGAAERVTKAKPTGDEGWDERKNALGAAFSPDARYVYFASKTGTTWTEKDLPHWSIMRRDLATGDEVTLIGGQGAAMHPALSHDGRWLAYASRWGAETGLRLRDLQTGEDRWIAYPIDHDGQDQGYYGDLSPRFSFEPGDRTMLLSVGGKLRRLDLATGGIAELPFTAPVHLGLGPLTRVSQRDDTGPVHARIIQWPRESPDGRQLLFSALGRLYVQALRPGARPRPLAGAPALAYQPAWSPDGRSIAFVTWSPDEAGAVWSMPATGGTPRRLTTARAFFTEPVWSPDGRRIAVLQASHYDRLHAASETAPDRPTDIVSIPAGGGAASLVARTDGARALGWWGDRLSYYGPAGLSTIRPDGGDLRREFSVVALSPSQYVGEPAPVDEVRLSPDGRRAIARQGSELYLLDVPARTGKEPPKVDLTRTPLPAVKLTRVGADYLSWTTSGIGWALGAHYRRVPLAAAGDDAEAHAQDFVADVTVPRDVPPGTLVLRGATAVTMRGGEVIAGADVVTRGGRIVAVGRTGSVPIPRDATIRDVSGKWIVPGFVDTHAHLFEIRRGIPERNQANFLANLAYGITSSLDPQAFTVDLFVYADMIDAGLMLGPRNYSVGRGVFRDSGIVTAADALPVLTRYRDYYRTRNIKSYMVGTRAQRQAMVEASLKIGTMPTTEGATDLNMNLTHFVDGFSGNEHALPVSPLHDDVIRLMAASRTAYTPTLGVLYGGLGAYNAAVIGAGLDGDAKFRRFTPAYAVMAKLRDRHWLPAAEQTYPRFAADAVRVQRAGGLVGLGSHGEVQGFGYHVELDAFASGGATPREVLQAATIGSAEVIGHQADIGSLEPGKYADLLVLDRDPLASAANLHAIGQVMKNGRLYDAGSLDELWPRRQPLPRLWWQDEAPPVSGGTPAAGNSRPSS